MNWLQFSSLASSIWLAPHFAESACTALGSMTLLATAHAWTYLS